MAGDIVMGRIVPDAGVDSREEALLHPVEDEGLSGSSDELIVLKFQETGDPCYFEELVRRYRGSILRVCLRIFDDTALADDVVQDVFSSVWREISRFEARNFRAWILTIARNRCVNELKRSFRRYEVGETAEILMTSDENSPDEQTRLELEACLRKLSAPQRIVVKLFYFHGLTYEEIAKRTGYPAKTVKTHIQNGRRMLRKLWGEDVDGR